MTQFKILCSLLLIASLCSACSRETVQLKVLQLNTWHRGTIVPDGFNGIVDIIDQIDPDVVFLCELHGKDIIEDVKAELQRKGKIYNGKYLDISTSVLSKYKLDKLKPCFTLENGITYVSKATMKVKGQKIALYSMHLDYTHYECYMPRGYSGLTWSKIDAPATDADVVLKANRRSYRDEGVIEILSDAQKEIESGSLVILGGDMNEPSHLDWQVDTQDLRDHNGLVINWDCSILLHKAGYKDTYREIYPNPLTHPGLTWPAGNLAAPLKKLQWTIGVDDRDRIDFIYYYPSKNIKLIEAAIVGPTADFYDGKIRNEKTDDHIINPKSTWPSDHKATLAIFELKGDR